MQLRDGIISVACAVLLAAWSIVASGSRAEASGMDGCPAAIVMTFGESAPTACRVAWCESRWDNSAIGYAGEVSFMQIHPLWFRQYDRQRLRDDEWYAAEVAYEISAGGTNWRPWSCR